MLSHIDQMDQRFFHWLRQKELSPRLKRWGHHFTCFGDGWNWATVVVLAILILPSEDWKPLLLTTLTAGGISVCLYWLVKLTVKRQRPCHAMDEVIAEINPIDRYSFPSGHTMNNMTLVSVLTAYLPAYALPIAIIPVAWGLFRVYLGVHFLSDVIIGLLLGLFAGGLGLTLAPWLWSLA
ncbi:MAG: phosphatase PAP2 family protein [Planctomycetota bacterium]|jgi:undecaprenyl-diphosphatase